jgi:short-subunit dehydrogenase
MSLPSRVLVTGGGSGIGAAIVLRLVDEGARVLITGRDASKLQAIAAEAPQQIGTLVADLTIDTDRKRVVEYASHWDHVGIDTLINNAGTSGAGFLEDSTPAQIDAVLQTNLVAPICLTQALLAHLKSLPEARIVNIGSVFGYIGYPSQVVYSASKFGLRGFSEALRRELAGTRITVQHVAPRATRTSLNSNAMNEVNRQLGNRVDDPDRVAQIVVAGLSTRRANAVIGWPEALFARVNAVMPLLVDGTLAKQLPVIRRFIQRGNPS